jgi:endonuclease-3
MGTPLADRHEQAAEVLNRLREAYPDATISLEFETRLELLVAVILSAQCTDERVNGVTEDLFEKYRSPSDYVGVPEEELAADIDSITYFNQKAGYIQGACERMLAEHDGQVPDTMVALTDLPGVGRKTANVVLQFGHDSVEGVVVDTHAQRLSRRLGITTEETPEAIERDLMSVLPATDWQEYTNLLIAHGRAVCSARNPDCEDCELDDVCPSSKQDHDVDLASGEEWT